MMPLSMGEVVVAGSGVGGLAAALAVARQRHWVTVLKERDPFVPPDAGVHLTPTALRALDQLGIGLDAHRRAVTVHEVHLVNGVTGRPISTVPTDSRHGRPHAVVHGGDLYDLLLEACGNDPAIRIREDTAVVHYEQTDQRLTVFLGTGERLRVDALIGADGVCSPVRRQLTGQAGRVSPYATFHTAVPRERVPARLQPQLSARTAVTLWEGPSWQLAHYPSGDRRVGITATCAHDAPALVRGTPATAAQVLDRMPRLAEAARELVGLGTEWRMWVPCDGDRDPPWCDRRVVLTGAAVRPAFQHSLPTAFQAVDDAVRLGNMMDCDPADFPQAFRSYARRRR